MLEERQKNLERGQYEILKRLDKIDERLERGDHEFERTAIAEAENRGMRKVIFGLGSIVVAGLTALGGVLLSHALPLVIKWTSTKM